MIRRVRTLFLAANPVDTSRLRLDQEVREINEKMRASDGRDSLELLSRWAVRPDDLLQALNEDRPTIVHFAGHASASSGIVLEDPFGHSMPVTAEALRALFCTLSGDIRLVVLNACYSQAQAEAITEAVDCAVGTAQAISDKAAILFAASFYRAIGFGRSVREAYEQGVTALQLQNVPEAHKVKLVVRRGVDPSRIILLKPFGEAPRPLDISRDLMSVGRFYRQTTSGPHTLRREGEE